MLKRLTAAEVDPLTSDYRYIYVDLSDVVTTTRVFLEECRRAERLGLDDEPSQGDAIVAIHDDGVICWENFGTMWGGDHFHSYASFQEAECLAFVEVRDGVDPVAIGALIADALIGVSTIDRNESTKNCRPSIAALTSPSYYANTPFRDEV